MSTSATEVQALRIRVAQIAPAHREPIQRDFERVAALPDGPLRDVELAKISRRLLRAEALSARRMMTR